MTTAYGVATADDRFIPLTDRKRLFLYDRTAKKIALATSFPWDQTAMIWQHKERLLLVPREGKALVYDRLRHIATIAHGTNGWRWGEDGTVWALSGGTLRVLHWRADTPALVTVATRGKPGKRYGSLAPGLGSMPPFRENTNPDWAAAWGDGKLVAGVENLAPADTGLVRTALRAAEALRISLDIPREARRLTLYRDNRRVGSFLLPTQPKPPPSPRITPLHPPPPPVPFMRGGPWRPPNTANHEHLAFTKDGKYLSWAIDDGTGVRLFVFEVPPP